MTTRILVFSPYAWRPHLTHYEGTIAKACQLRGAEVEYLLCDGLLPECDNHWDSFLYNQPRPFDLCRRCQEDAEKILTGFDLPFRWLGRYLSEAEREEAFDWAQSLSPAQIPRASYGGDPVAEWVQSSVISYFRQYPPDLKSWRVVNTYRGFLLSASLVATALKNYLNERPVDAALLFNGRQSLTRVAFEVFKQLGIRELTHEFPYYQRGHIMVKPNSRCWSIEPFSEFWRSWGGVPLNRAQLEKTLKWLRNRRYGKELSWYAYNRLPERELSIREALRLTNDRPLMALFTSSTDETAGDAELTGPYDKQAEWVEDVVAWVRQRADVELVIRIHPHLAGNTGLGRAHDEYAFYDRMRSALPSNVRLVMPDDPLNSYLLMDEADICLSFGSSVGLEMALMGKPVVLASRSTYEDGTHILKVHTKRALPEVLERSLQPVSSRELRREGFRLAYYYVFSFELPFPLVSMPDVMDVRLNYDTPEALAPGEDDSLDRICDYLMDLGPLFPSPSDAELARDTAEEDAFFAELDQMAEPMRDLDYERLLRRTYRMNLLGRSIQKAVQKLPVGTGSLLNRIGKAVYLPVMRWSGRDS